MDNEALQIFIESLTHDIKNPLASIKGFSALLEKDLDAMPEQQKMANYILQGVEHIEKRLNEAATELIDLNREEKK